MYRLFKTSKNRLKSSGFYFVAEKGRVIKVLFLIFLTFSRIVCNAT
nr:MAG TPA: hypothetical protein [Caudoviricetes sp.]